MAEYGLSTYGRYILIREGPEDFNVIRKTFVVMTLLFGCFVKYREATAFWSMWSLRKRCNTFTVLFAVYMCSGLIHMTHFADNIARPVDYYEPRYLYREYVLSTMEITFFVNFPITLIGFAAITGMISSLLKCQVDLLGRNCFLMLLYVAGSLLTVGHYNYEPPSSFTPFVNFTIAGEGILALLVAVVNIVLWCVIPKRPFKESGVDMQNLLSDYSKDKRSDTEDVDFETFNHN